MMREKYFMEDSDDNAFSLIADFEGNEAVSYTHLTLPTTERV